MCLHQIRPLRQQAAHPGHDFLGFAIAKINFTEKKERLCEIRIDCYGLIQCSSGIKHIFLLQIGARQLMLYRGNLGKTRVQSFQVFNGLRDVSFCEQNLYLNQ